MSRALARRRPVTNQWGIPWPNESITPRRTPSIVATSSRAPRPALPAPPARSSPEPALRSRPRRRARARPSRGPRKPTARADFVPPEPRVGAQFIQHPGSDYMVDVLQGARLRLRRRQSRLGVRGHARVAHQPRRQPQARDPDGAARRSRRRDRARLRQGGRQTDDDADARHRRPAARVDGPVPSVVRPRSRVRDRRPRPQPDERRQSPAQRAGHGRDRPRLHEDGRRADEPRRVRATSRCAPTRSAARRRWARRCSSSTRSCRKRRSPIRASSRSRGCRCRACRRATRAPSAKRRGCSRPPSGR